MCLAVCKYIFIAISVLLILALSFRIFFPKIFENNNKISPVIAFIAGLILLYIFLGLILTIFLPTVKYKLIILLFTLSPFIIGKLVTYKKLKFYSIIQLFCVILSVGFLLTI